MNLSHPRHPSHALAAAHPSGSIDFWFEFASNYSYLSVMRIEQAAERLNVAVRWKPFLLGPIFRSFGWQTSPFVLQKAKGEYVWKDMARLCHQYGLPWRRPSQFPRGSLLPLRIAMLGAEEPWMAAFCQRVMTLNFAQDTDIDSAPLMLSVLTELGLAAEKIIDEAQAESNKLRLRQQTEQAQSLGIFGAPMFFAGDEMFWGNDRMDDALAFAAGGDRAGLTTAP
jgi:2-hydroxychromene-2-carboxylate isomerase